MTTSAFWAFGSALQLGDGATPETFASIAEITDLVPPKESRDSTDVTSHTSTDRYREFIPGMRDGGEVTIEANWLPTNATHNSTTGIRSTFLANVTKNWKIVLPDSVATISFAGFVTNFEPTLPLEEQGKLSVTIKISGPVTYTV